MYGWGFFFKQFTYINFEIFDVLWRPLFWSLGEIAPPPLPWSAHGTYLHKKVLTVILLKNPDCLVLLVCTYIPLQAQSTVSFFSFYTESILGRYPEWCQYLPMVLNFVIHISNCRYSRGHRSEIGIFISIFTHEKRSETVFTTLNQQLIVQRTAPAVGKGKQYSIRAECCMSAMWSEDINNTCLYCL